MAVSFRFVLSSAFISSAVSFTLNAATASARCFCFVAPTIGAVTPGLLNSHANATLDHDRIYALSTADGRIETVRVVPEDATVDETRTAIADSRHIRQAALANRVTYYTSMAGCEAAVEGMKHRDDLEVMSLQELHAELV